jgi:transposase
VAHLIDVSDDRIWRVLHRHVGEARAREDFADVRRIGADETASRRGQRYVALFHDLDRRRLLFATPGRDRVTFARFADDLAQHGATAPSSATQPPATPDSSVMAARPQDRD